MTILTTKMVMVAMVMNGDMNGDNSSKVTYQTCYQFNEKSNFVAFQLQKATYQQTAEECEFRQA